MQHVDASKNSDFTYHCLPCVFKEGNDFGEVFDEMKYIQTQVLLVKLRVNEPGIDFCPSFQECWDIIHRAFMEIIKSAEKLPRVQHSLSTTNYYILHKVVYI